jgi:ADP-ribose pyrophosphatase
MSDSNDWRIGARTEGHDYKVFRTAFFAGSHPTVGAQRFSVIESPDWVNIIAVTPRDEVVVIRQFRPGTAKVQIEIPGGMIDPGETPEVAAPRELAEETGYTAKRWRLLGKVAPNPAIQNNYLYCYLAEGAELTAPRHLDGSEVIEVELVPLAQVRAMMRDGTIDHALVITAFGLLGL